MRARSGRCSRSGRQGSAPRTPNRWLPTTRRGSCDTASRRRCAPTATEVFPLRSSIREPMSYGRLYLLGDSAHIIPPMGAKGMNLALFDAEVFAGAVREFTATGDESGLLGCSATCLARTWRYQEYSNWLADICTGRRDSPSGAAVPSGNSSCGPGWSGCSPRTPPLATTRKCSPAWAEPLDSAASGHRPLISIVDQ
jgi:hypothetical protein